MEKITEDYVSFETAKLLEEKGYDGDFDGYYNNAGYEISRPNPNLKNYHYYKRPSLYCAMKWLRELHSIENVIDVCKYGEDKKTMYAWTPVVIKEDLLEYPVSQTYGSVFGGICETYREAAENGIVYCLENLI